MSSYVRVGLVCSTIVLLAASCQPPADPQDAGRDIFVPSTISPEAQQVLRGLIQARPYTREAPAPDDLDAWRQMHAAFEAASENQNQQAVESHSPA